MQQLAILILLAAPVGAQSTWYVDVNGTPPGAGTLAEPYTSIQYAIDQPTTVQLDSIVVAPGSYVENIDFGTKVLLVSSTGGPETCTIQAAGPGHVVNVLEFVKLDGFTITGGHGPTDNDGIHLEPGGSDLWLERCVVEGNAGRGIYYGANGDDGVLHSCTLASNGLEGLYMKNGSAVDMVDTIVWGNGLAPVLSFGPHPQHGFFYCDIENNTQFGGGCNFNFCGNFSFDPLFVDAANGDYHLLPGSPCINAGDPSSALDPDGTRADVGAYAFDTQAAPGPSVYCVSTVNSQGCLPAIGSTGSPSMAGAPFDITCSSVINNKLGLLFYGYQSKSLPYQGGTLCVTGALKRTPVQSAGGNPPPDDCSGLYSYDFDARIQSGIDVNLVEGAVVFAQYWYRDPAHLSGFTTARSDALAFTILP